MAREFPAVPFERYVDDAVVHCTSHAQAVAVAAAIGGRMEQVGLRLHPGKPRVVYCKDGNRRGSHGHTSFAFLGFTFRQRRARNKQGRSFSAFLPVISKEALKKTGDIIADGGATAAEAVAALQAAEQASAVTAALACRR